MNWKILFAGGVIISIIFLSLFGFYIIDSRKSLTNNIINDNFPKTTYFEKDNIPLEAQKAIEKETYSQTILVRGNITAYIDNTITIAIENQQTTNLKNVVGLLDISLSNLDKNQFQCWPEYFGNNNNKISIKNSYIPLNDNSYLYLKGETTYPNNNLSKFIDTGKYVLALLKTPPIESGKLISDTTDIPTQIAKQLVILGCK